MAIKPEDIRKAKKFLENKKLSIKDVKPREFAQVSQNMNLNFENLLKLLVKKVTNGTPNTSDKK